ncbi:hypothetical protein [Streptomyces paludis]|uniref:Uncharacterized protein n=1 Tax=Streptomyces paludis TaxID=2282738 RepID=A0A345HSH2_9ACTN|nr:hypothetical protein [Streptomyces paludis]AXG79646.1 hypothetical protein DVK44_20585 [Streptomyces paludis]
MVEPVSDARLWGVVALGVSFLVLVVTVLWAASSSSADPDYEVRALLADEAPGAVYAYTCHCHRASVLVTVPVGELPCRRGWGRI